MYLGDDDMNVLYGARPVSGTPISTAGAEEPPNPSIYTAPGRIVPLPPADDPRFADPRVRESAQHAAESSGQPDVYTETTHEPGWFEGVGQVGDKLNATLTKVIVGAAMVLALVLAIEVAK